MRSGEPMSVRCQMHRRCARCINAIRLKTSLRALAEGLITGHPGKPAFRFDAREVDDIIEYLKSLER